MSAPSSWLPVAFEDAMTLLHQHFDNLMLPHAAVDWLIMLGKSIQTFEEYEGV
jgi:hypothetical protein